MTPEERKQYSRHLILDEIGEQGQIRLKNAKVLVIGAGGLGCPILQYLSAAGVGTIGVIDDDKVDQSNLQRQILYKHQDIGKYKVEIAVANLSALNPYITFHEYKERLTTENVLNLFEKYDIIVDGSDNFPTRYLVSDACGLLNKPLVFGSIFKFEGQVSVFNYQNGPTYRCLFPSPPKSSEVPNCSEIGVLGVLPGIIGCLQANEVIKIVCGLGDVLSGKLLLFNAMSMNFVTLAIENSSYAEVKKLNENYEEYCEVFTSEEITYEELDLDTYFLLDVRTYTERSESNIGGLHIPLDELEKRYAELDRTKKIVVYCKSGLRSLKAIKILNDKKFNSLYNLKGGILAAN